MQDLCCTLPVFIPRETVVEKDSKVARKDYCPLDSSSEEKKFSVREACLSKDRKTRVSLVFFSFDRTKKKEEEGQERRQSARGDEGRLDNKRKETASSGIPSERKLRERKKRGRQFLFSSFFA